MASTPGAPEAVDPAAEAALVALGDALGRGAARLALRDAEGGAGAGLAAGLEARLGSGRYRVVHVPYGALQAGEICAWVLGLLDEPAEGDPEAALAAAAIRRAARGETVVVVLSETRAMPVATARRLVDLVEQTGGALRLVLLLEDGARADRLRSAFEPAEEARLAGADAPALREVRRPAPVSALPGPVTLPYVPRAESERVLDGLEQALRGGEDAALVTGRPGIGKTVVLRALEARLRSGFTPLRVPYASLGPEAFARFALALLQRAVSESNAEAALLAHAAACARAGVPLLLLVDDAQAAPPETLARGIAWTAREGGPRVVWCLSGAAGARVPDPLGTVSARFSLDTPLDEAESGAFVRAWLEAASAPEAAWQALDAAAVRGLHTRSAGLPAALVREADAWLRGAVRDGASAAPAAEAPGPAGPAPQPIPQRERDGVSEEVQPGPSRAPQGRRPRSAPRRRRVAAALVLAGAALGLGYAFTGGNPAGLLPTSPEPPLSAAVRPGDAPAPEAAPAASRAVEASQTPPAAALASEAPAIPAPQGAPPAALPADPIPVHINAVPWARIRIDGREMGTTPLGNVPLAPGTHRLEARFADGRVLEREVEVSAEQRHLVLEP